MNNKLDNICDELQNLVNRLYSMTHDDDFGLDVRDDIRRFASNLNSVANELSRFNEKLNE